MDESYGRFAWIYDSDKNLTPATSVSSIDQLSNWLASQESTLNFPGPEQIIQIKKSRYRTSGR